VERSLLKKKENNKRTKSSLMTSMGARMFQKNPVVEKVVQSKLLLALLLGLLIGSSKGRG
jgi:hypothetical protein